MQISAQIKNYIESLPLGKIITYKDFGELRENKPQALAKALERLVKKNVLIRQAKGAFYRPKDTMFGPVSPSDDEIISFLTCKGDRITGILTGQSVYLKLQIATQIPNILTIASITPKKKQTIGKLQIQFVRSYISSIEKSDVPLLQLLEALRFIKKAQDCTPDEILVAIKKRMRNLTDHELKKLTKERMESFQKSIVKRQIYYLTMFFSFSRAVPLFGNPVESFQEANSLTAEAQMEG